MIASLAAVARGALRYCTAKPVKILVGIGFLKILAFLLLHHFLGLQAFTGSNAKDHYLPVAARMAAEGRFNGIDSRPDSKIGPGYPAILAMTQSVFGAADLDATVCLQFGADLITAIALFFIGRRLAGNTSALIAGLGWQLFPPAVVLATWITAETIFVSILTVSSAILLLSVRKKGLGFVVLAGLLLGIATYFRATTLLLPIFYAAVWIYLGSYRKAACFVLTVYLTILPWTLRNCSVLDDCIVMSVGSGSTVLQGSDARFFSIDGKDRYYPGLMAEAAKAGIVKPESPKESGIDRWMQQIGIYVYRERWRNRKLSFITFGAHKAVRLWYGTESATPKSQLALGLLSLLIVPIGLAGILRWRRKWKPEAWMLAAQLAYFIALHFATLPEQRYMLPVYPLLILGASTFAVDFAATKSMVVATRSSGA